MRLRRLLLSTFIPALIWSVLPTAMRADEAIQASGSFVIGGNPNCTLSQCTQIFDFSFTVVGVTYPLGNNILFADILSSDLIGAGVLGVGPGPGSLFAYNLENFQGQADFYVPLTGGGAEVDLFFTLNETASGPTLEPPGYSGFYSCTSQSCIEAFLPPGATAIDICGLGCPGDATFQLLDYSTAVVRTSESSSVILLLSGIVLLGLAFWVSAFFEGRGVRHLTRKQKVKIPVLATSVLSLGFCLLSAVSAHANDEVMQISGTLVTVGNSASNCTPSPCTIVVDFSTQLLITDEPTEGLFGIQNVPNTANYSAQSSLGDSSGSFDTYGPVILNDGTFPVGYIVMPGFPDEVDLNFEIIPTNGGFDFQSYGALFFSCESTACSQDFIMPQSGLTYCVSGYECSGVAYPIALLDFSATRVPEPSGFELIFCGISLFVVAWFGFRSVSTESIRRRLNTCFSII